MREGYKNTEVGVIPEDWEVKSTGELFSFSGGMSISRQQLCEDGVNYLHYGDIHKRKESILDLDKDKEWMPKLNQEFDLIKDDVKLNTGDVVFADASEDYEGIGKSIVVLNKNNDEVVSGLHTIVAKGSNEVLDTQYKRYCFSTENVRKQFRKLATGTSVYGISRENIKKIKILVPPLKEQEKIAEILSTVDSQIDDTENLIEKSKELKKGLMQKLLTKGIGHREFKKTEVGEIPIEWKVENNFIKIFSGFGFKLKEYSKKGLPLIRINNVTHGKILDEEWVYVPNSYAEKYSEFVVKKGDILLSLNRPITQGKLKICMVDMEQAMLYQRVGKLVMDNEIYYPKFYYYYMQSRIFMKKLECGLVGTDQPYIKNSEFKDIKFPVPSIEEQKSIVKIFTSLDDQICEYENEKQKLCEVKKALIQQLLMGKIRVI